MKNKTAIILTALLLASIISCKDKSTETLPREVFSMSPEGIVMRSAPDAKSEMVSVIPFSQKVTITENSDLAKPQTSTDKSKWYKTEWSGKKGWIQETSFGGADSVTEQIKTSFTAQKSNFTADFVKTFESSSIQITDTYIYPGGEMEPAKIFFLSGGIMVVNSKIFSENYSNTFFQYEFMNEGNLLKIKFIDSRLNFAEYSDIENSSRSVFKIDKNELTIIYQVKDKNFFFFNWGFHKE